MGGGMLSGVPRRNSAPIGDGLHVHTYDIVHIWSQILIELLGSQWISPY